MEFESNPRVRAIWERFVGYELGHLHMVKELFKEIERRDPAEVLPQTLPEPIQYRSQREFVRETLRNEVDLRARGKEFIHKRGEKPDFPSVRYREQINADGSPSEAVAAGYIWTPGTELNGDAAHPELERVR